MNRLKARMVCKDRKIWFVIIKSIDKLYSAIFPLILYLSLPLLFLLHFYTLNNTFHSKESILCVSVTIMYVRDFNVQENIHFKGFVYHLMNQNSD